MSKGKGGKGTVENIIGSGFHENVMSPIVADKQDVRTLVSRWRCGEVPAEHKLRTVHEVRFSFF